MWYRLKRIGGIIREKQNFMDTGGQNDQIMTDFLGEFL